MILAGVKIPMPEMELVSHLPNAETKEGPIVAIVPQGN